MTAKLTKEQIAIFKEDLMKCLDEMRDALELEQQNLESQPVVDIEQDSVDSELMACIDLLYDLNYLTQSDSLASDDKIPKPDDQNREQSNLIRFER